MEFLCLAVVCGVGGRRNGMEMNAFEPTTRFSVKCN